jgi:hypothetical protein
MARDWPGDLLQLQPLPVGVCGITITSHGFSTVVRQIG